MRAHSIGYTIDITNSGGEKMAVLLIGMSMQLASSIYTVTSISKESIFRREDVKNIIYNILIKCTHIYNI